ncbi:uncharacterized protein At3g43530-like [Brassica napus]|uniref:uncharacterized protein At3g43530-like n=1 Tax=Brassica napus TaxID=3708 RepID=UPI00207A1FB6|nr:uncharacterized protein At3g43530-like [Brassica napus]
MTSKLRFTKKKKESPPKKKKKSSPTKKKEIEPAKKEMTLSTGKKKRGRSSSAEEHEADDGGSSSQPTKRPRLTSNRNPKNLQPNPAAASASPTQPDNEETPIVPPATSEDPPPTKRQNPSHQQDPPDASISRSSTKGGTPYSEQGDNEEMGSHGEPTRSREPNATEEQIMVKEMAGGAIKPHKFYFKPAEYGKPCKLSSRCHQTKFIKLIDNFHATEKKWFYAHPQFKHIIHMECSSRRKVMGLWMLLIHTIKVDKKRQAWFVVNGVPIRYSIREHGLISGLYCHTYPENYESIGSLKFAKKYFQQPPKKKGDDPPELKVTAADVLKKLKKMKYDGSHERLRMAVLYFLATVIFQRSRYGTPIDHFLLRMVNDLRVCHTFPWGRYTFDDSLKEIKHMVKHFRGKIPTVKASWTFPGFINPLEILAFESIQVLKENFREDVEEFDDSCPRMCKSRFLANGSSGYALSEIYEKLGETKEISNILKPTGSESDLSVEIFDDGLWDDVELGDDGDIDDPIVDGWNKIIIHDQVKILWEDLYKMDVKTRKIEHEPERICEELEGPRVCEETEAGCESLKTRVAQLEASIKVRDDIIGQLEARIKSMENDRNPRDRFGNMEDLFDHDRFDTGGGQENDDNDKDATKEGETETEQMAEDDADKEATKDGENEPEKESKVDADKEATKEGDNELEEMAEDDADKEATEDGENEHEKDSHVDADKEATKEGENEPEQMAEDDTDKEATKEVENDPEHALQEDLEVMVAAAEKFEKEVVEKKAAEKEVVEKKAWEKESTDEKDGDAEEDSPKKTKRVPKPSRMKQSPYVEK